MASSSSRAGALGEGRLGVRSSSASTDERVVLRLRGFSGEATEGGLVVSGVRELPVHSETGSVGDKRAGWPLGQARGAADICSSAMDLVSPGCYILISRSASAKADSEWYMQLNGRKTRR